MMTQEIQPLDEDYLRGIFEQLGRLEIQLDPDPLVYGPKRMNQKVALARKMLTDCERLFLDAAQKQAGYKRLNRAAELIWDRGKKLLLANDPEVRAGRAVSEREAIAAGKLKAEVQAVADTAQAVEDLDTVIAVIKAKRSDLRDIQGRLRDQIRLCQEEIGLGGRWGSRRPNGVELQPGQGFATGDDVAAIDAVIQQVRGISGAEVHLPADDADDDAEDLEETTEAVVAEAAEVPVAEAAEAPPVAEPLPGACTGFFPPDDEYPALVARRAAGTPPMKPITEPIVFPLFQTVVPIVNLTDPALAQVVAEHNDLYAEFGFIPHCEVCGEEQTRTPSGMTCANGHGGAASVPPPADPLETEAVPEGLPGDTTDADAVAGFLAVGVPEAQPKPKQSRFQVEEEDGLNLEAILEGFNR